MQATRLIGWLAVALLAVPFGARAAEDGGERFQALEERMRVLEDKLAASSATIEAQQELLQRATPDVAQGSGVDGFFNKLEVGGFVTGSYLYNFNQPSIPSSGSGTQSLNQFNNRHNEFSFDAAKLEIGKVAASPGEAGFQIDMLYGQNADILRRASPTDVSYSFFTDTDGDGVPSAGDSLSSINPSFSGDSDNGVFIQEAYASYNMGGVTWKLGKFETLMGWEVLDSHKNANVTHGLLFTWAIPLYHTGLLASGSFSEGVTWSLGMVDGFNNVIENNDGKALIGQLAASSGGLSGVFNVFWGGEGTEGVQCSVPTPTCQPGSTDDLMIFDAILSYSPSDALTFWLNADLGKQEDQVLVSLPSLAVSDSDPYYWGVAAGGKFQISEKLGFALRGEYFDDEDDMRGTAFSGFGLGFGVDDAAVELWSLTSTLSYAFTQNLKLRGELRWDHANNDISTPGGGPGGGAIFPDGGSSDGNTDDESVLGIVEVSYIFD